MDNRFIPYGKQLIDETDCDAVLQVLRSDWLTTGPRVQQFEEAIANYVGAKHAVAVNSGTAALHTAVAALELSPGDEVIVTPMTFAASANAILYVGATPVFADVNEDTLLIDPACVERVVTQKTRAIVAVDFAGQACDYNALQEIADKHNLAVIDDAAHALGTEYRGARIGSIADLTTFSFHPVKPITTGEGGIITTNNSEFATQMQRFRNHGITSDFRARESTGSHYYEMQELGFNYRISDIQCALGASQLKKIDNFLEQRRAIASQYDAVLSELQYTNPLARLTDSTHAYHIYVVTFDCAGLNRSRDDIFREFREAGIGVNVHYVPVHLHPYYRKRLGTAPGLCPIAEEAYEKILTLPIHPSMEHDDVARVCDMLERLDRAR